MAKPFFLQKAHPLNPDKIGIAGRFISEKLDGQRFMWDGGISRGMLAKDVPYANTQKDSRYLDEQPATGLWSNYGKAIQAPDWWLDRFPPFPVEGELWTGYNDFQNLSSIVRSSVNISTGWDEVRAMVFDAPPPEMLFSPRHITPSPSVDFKIEHGAIAWWLAKYAHEHRTRANTTFAFRYKFLQKFLEENDVIKLVPHFQLPTNTPDAWSEVNRFTDNVLDLGGEGSMIRAMHDLWLPERVHTLHKYKPFTDAEGEVVGWTWGRETERGSKLLGLMGALILKIKAGTFKLSGFTDAEREMQLLQKVDVKAVAGQDVDPKVARSLHFPIGTKVTYKYRKLTDDGLPSEARFWRKA